MYTSEMLLLIETVYCFAEEDGDYDAGSYIITFIAGNTSAEFEVTIVDDDVHEDNENFSLIIHPLSLPMNVTVGEATVTIIDDDGENLFKLAKATHTQSFNLKVGHLLGAMDEHHDVANMPVTFSEMCIDASYWW